MYQLQYYLGTLPVSLVLLSNGTIVWIKTSSFSPIFDLSEDPEAVSAIFTEDGFMMESDADGKESFSYNTIYEYKVIPLMKAWLVQQNLQEPDVMFQM